MFGLENQKSKKKEEPFEFDLEVELRQPGHYQKLAQMVHDRLHSLKDKLREGEEHGDFEKLGLLVYGYSSLLKVITRVVTPKTGRK